MRLSQRLCVVLLAGALSVSVAAAAPGEKGQRAPGAGKAAVAAPAILSKLDLTPDQQTRIRAAAATLKSERQKAQALSTSEEKRQAMRTAAMNYQTTLKSVLTAEQQEQLKGMAQTARQYRGSGRIGQQVATMNLSSEQKSKIQAIMARYQPEMQKLRAEQRSASDKQSLRGRMQELNEKLMQEMKAVLTPAQLQQMGPVRGARKNAGR